MDWDPDLITGIAVIFVVVGGAYLLGYYRGKANVRHYH